MWKLGWGLHLSQSCFNEVRSQPLGSASEHQTLANYPFKVRNVFFFFQQMELHFLITQIYFAIGIHLFYLCCIRTIRVMKGRLRESAKLQQTLQSRSPEVLISTYLLRSPDHLRVNKYQLHPWHNIHFNPSSARPGWGTITLFADHRDLIVVSTYLCVPTTHVTTYEGSIRAAQLQYFCIWQKICRPGHFVIFCHVLCLFII